MNLKASLLRQLENPALSPNARAEVRCQAARELEDTGDYEAAREALGELWRGVGEPPHVEGLEQSTAAEVLLRAGTLTGWIGSCNQIKDAQEKAKDLISRSIRIAETVNYPKKLLEAQAELAYCYWRTGEYDEARIILEGALTQLTADSELKAKAVLRLAIVEWGAARHLVAFRILTDNAPLFERINSHTVKGGYYNQLAVALKTLAESRGRKDYLDRAFIEFEAASYHFQQAGHHRYRANVENNLGNLFSQVGKHREAHEHLDRARRLTVILKDKAHTARVDETRARVMLAEGRAADAERIVRAGVCSLENGGQQWLLAESLITHGRALARLGRQSQARAVFVRAIEVSRESGARSRAGEAALAMLEELGEWSFQKGKEAAGTLDAELRQYEAELIRDALRRAQGSVTRAAHLLGISHQRLSQMLDGRHKELQTERTPVVRRRRGIIKEQQTECHVSRPAIQTRTLPVGR